MISGNLRWAQVHSVICVCERYSVALKILAEGMFARGNFIEMKGARGGKAEENAVSLIHKIQA